MRKYKTAILVLLIGISNFILADSWHFFPGKQEYKFGNIKIIQIIDAKGPTPTPDFILDFYEGNKLKTKYRNVYVEAVFKSPDSEYFVGLSNSGHPGTAYIVLDRKGNLLREVKHDYMNFVEYCEYSLIISRKWFNFESPDIKFIIGDYNLIIQVNGCNGKKYNLVNKVMWDGNSFLTSKKESLDNMYNKIIVE